MQYQLLDWDTKFFGVTVARIDEPILSGEQLSKAIDELKARDVELVYWSSSREVDSELLKRFGGSLVDRKTTFLTHFGALEEYREEGLVNVEPYSHGMSTRDIEALALQSGERSRFVVDKKIPREKFIELYTIWANRSLTKEIADEVLVIRDEERILGMATLGDKNGRGDIGLVAVDASCRGKNYGKELVRAAQRWFVERGYQCGQVVTQGDNVAACQLYLKCGYSVEKVEYFHHFWLSKTRR